MEKSCCVAERSTESCSPEKSGRSYVPASDVLQNDSGYLLVVDIPGVDEQSLDIAVERNTLTLTGNVPEQTPEGFKIAHRGYRSGNYTRKFSLPDDVDVGAIEAAVKDGVLRLSLPKSLKAQPRRIQVVAH